MGDSEVGQSSVVRCGVRSSRVRLSQVGYGMVLSRAGFSYLRSPANEIRKIDKFVNRLELQCS